MASFIFKGLDSYLRLLELIRGRSEETIKAAVYDGAGYLANQVKAELVSDVQTVSDKQALAAYRKRTPVYISDTQKRGLVESLGLAPMTKDKGYINTKLGFDGYNAVSTERWPDGQPNMMVARMNESGSTGILKQPFIRETVARERETVIQIMDDKINEEIQKID